MFLLTLEKRYFKSISQSLFLPSLWRVKFRGFILNLSMILEFRQGDNIFPDMTDLLFQR